MRWNGMGRQVVELAGVAAIAVACAAGEARAVCQGCGADLLCTPVPVGAGFCVGNGKACFMAGRCVGGGGGYYDSFAMVQVSVLEDAPGLPRIGRARVVRGAGPVSTGRRAPAVARRAAGGAAGEAALVWSGVGLGEGVTAAFRSRTGDGFTLRRDAAGRGARVQVRALAGGRPGEPLADETLGEHDALVVRVTLEGRPRVLVLQAATLRGAEAQARERDARLALRGGEGAPLDPLAPPFELDAVDD